MNCPACGTASRAGAKFCQECGAPLEQRCPSCGAAVTREQKFCAECGSRLPAADAVRVEPARAESARFAAPSGYTPAHLAERILKDRAVLTGERKQVTVLFADVSGFTRLAERLDPEDVHAFMNRAFELMLAEIHHYEGTVNQFLGDGLMALFGAPVAHEDHARRAALAALGMQSALGAFRAELTRTRGIEFQVRIGLNTGLVVVGAIGDNLRMDYTAVGDTTNVAARMQQMARPGQILLADPTRRLIEPYFDLASLGTVSVKNRVEPIAAWILEGARPADVPQALSALVGRGEALGALERAAESARAGRGRAVYVVGEPGMGKSRLLRELRARLGDTMSWIEGRCLSFGQSTPFLPFMEILRQVFAIADSDSEAQVIEKVTRTLRDLGKPAAALAPYIRFALAVDPGDPLLARMDPTERISRLLHGMTQIVSLTSRVRPTVMVIEDLHWIDSSSEAYLHTIVDNLAGMPSLLILTWRPTYRAPFNEHTYVSRLVLEPLVETDALALVRSTLGIENLPDDLAHLIARKAEGNPFFLEEIGRALLETGAVRPRDGRLVLMDSPSAITVPDRVQDVIAARIDRLTEDQKRTVQTASVIGHEFTLRLLRRVADAPERAERALGELKALEFVFEKAALDDLEYCFKHVLTQDVAYESMLHARRRELHGKIGAGIEEIYADRLEERVEELAYHFLRGEVWDKAARYARHAGDRAAALCADDKAVEFYERALDALQRLPDSQETAALAIDLRVAMRAPLWRGGQLDRLSTLFKEALALAERHGETARLDVVYAFLTQYHWAKGEQRQAIQYGERCLETAARRDDVGLAVTGHYYLGWAYFMLGRFEQALAHDRALLALLEGPRQTERFGLSGLPYCGACAQAAWCLIETGDIDGAFEYLDRGDRVAEAAGHLYSTVPLGTVRGRALLQQGRVAGALSLLEHVVGICREKRFVGQLMLALATLSRAYSLVGRYDDAIAAGRESVKLKDDAGAPVTRSDHVGAVAEAYLAAGRLDEAEAAAREALEWAERLEERYYAGSSRWLLGEVARRRGDRDAASQSYRASLAIAEELGAKPLADRCRAALFALG
jgi:class 3 adenylate cyclase/tetratricopeptide (TPR) repeat protein